MREAEEEERIEQEQKKLQTPPLAATFDTPQVTSLSEEELLAEMRRRAEVKQ
jgi:hypothetical protein